MDEQVDVAIVGAGPAGCAAAALLGERGHHVLLLDRGAVPHPRLCTHAIMPSAVPVLARMGVLDRIEAAGAQRWWGVRLSLDGVTMSAPLPRRWTAYPYGLSLRRHLLDPLLLDAAQHPSVEVRTGWSAEALLGADGVVTGVRVCGSVGEERRVGARLVVAADGRRSRLARAARLRERLTPNRHEALIAYLAGVPPEDQPMLEGYYDRGRSASLLPADHGLRVAGVMTPSHRWPRAEWPERMLAELCRYQGMDERLRHARFASAPTPVRGLRNVLRVPSRPGFAVVGDAAIQTDPSFGQGIAWALRSGARLADAVHPLLTDERGSVTLPNRHGWEPSFVPLWSGIALASLIPPGSLPERMLVRSAAASPRTSALALRLIAGFAAAPRDPGYFRTAQVWLREALIGA